MMALIFIGIILNHLGMLNGWMLFWYIVAWILKVLGDGISLFK